MDGNATEAKKHTEITPLQTHFTPQTYHDGVFRGMGHAHSVEIESGAEEHCRLSDWIRVQRRGVGLKMSTTEGKIKAEFRFGANLDRFGFEKKMIDQRVNVRLSPTGRGDTAHPTTF
jgi:hypothetical protein